MSENFCDCGFEIPERASYCPGCGKPLTVEAREQERRANAFQRPREDDIEGDEPTDPVGDLTFGQPGVLRSCYRSAAIAAIIISLPMASLLCFIILPAAGFYSVHTYRRQTKQDVTLRGGAKLGFLTGTLAFALFMILLTIMSVMPGSPGLEGTFDQLEEVYQESGQTDLVEQIGELRQNPTALALFVLIILACGFALTTGFTTAGGALGAKVLEKEKAS